MKLLSFGAALTLAVTAILWLFWGDGVLVAGIVFGGLATIIQLGAVAAMRPAWNAPLNRFVGRWGFGMALRVGGIVVFVVAVWADRDVFPPAPTAFAYLGVLIPLLFMEMRFLK